MNKLFLTLLAFCVWDIASAQIKIGDNPTTVGASSALELESTNKALVLTRVANTAAITSPVNGMMVYDISSKCVKFYEDGAWSKCISSGADYAAYSVSSIFEQIGQVADDTSQNSNITASQLTAIGATGVIAANQAVYQDYMDQYPNAFSSTATLAQVQAMVNAVNASVPTSGGTATITSFNCNTGSEGFLMVGRNLGSTVKQIITVNVSSIGTYNISTNNQSGIIFSASGTFTATGLQTVTLTANSNVPSAAGTFTWTLNKTESGGTPCSFSRVINATFPSTITLGQMSHFTTSVYDQNYLPYTAPTAVAAIGAKAADGTNEAKLIDIQGVISTTGVNIKIPVVSATASGTLPAFISHVTIPAELTQDGISRVLTLTYPQQNYTTATKSINAVIKAVGGNLNVKKLDINNGVGNDNLGVLMGQLLFHLASGSVGSVQLRAIAGIPDKMFGVADNTGNLTSHLMLYNPVNGEDRKIWLNNNLGADYANINKTSFNPNTQATSATDFRAYGSFLQWGRKADGHELINWTSGTAGTPVNGTTNTRNNAPTNALFITVSADPYDWRSSQSDTLWATAASANNPCPTGFRVPTLTEQTTLVTAASITNSATAASSTLKFTVPGYRSYSEGTVSSVGSYANYWSSSVSGTDASYYIFYGSRTETYNTSRAYGVSVRCLKN